MMLKQVQHDIIFKIFVVCILFFRILLVFHNSQFGPDEGIFALKARQFISCIGDPSFFVDDPVSKDYIKKNVQPCGIIPLVGIEGRLGVPYGPYPTYWLTFLYWITNFQIPLLLFIHSILFLIPAFLLTRCIDSKKLKIWILLLSLTSPLFVTFSTQGFWDTPWLLVLSSLILYLGLKIKQNVFTSLIIGILLGISLGSHLQSIPFVAGFLIWYFLTYRNWKLYLPILFGITILVLPYAVGVYQIKKATNLQFHLPISLSFDVLYFIPTIFLRFWGASNAYSGIKIIISVFILFSIQRLSKMRKMIKHPLFPLIFILLIFEMAFAFYTRTYRDLQETMLFWWITPIALAYLTFFLFPKRYPIILGFFISINILYVLSYQSSELNVWNQMEKSDELCLKLPKERFESYAVLGMTALQNPHCFETISFKSPAEAQTVNPL